MYSLRDMWRDASPSSAISDFRDVYRQAGKNRIPFMILSALGTVGLFSLLAGESWKKARALPEITYITAWPDDRTEAETRAFIAENQRRKEAMQAQQDEIDKVGRDMYKALGRASGMDVDRMEKQAEAERAAAAASEQAQVDAILKANGER